MSVFEKVALCYLSLVKSYRILMIKLVSFFLFEKKNKYENILINRDGEFGDAIVALPAISIIRQNFPGARIDLLSVTISNLSFNRLGLEDNLLNNLYCINKKQRKKTMRKLRAQSYDLFIQLPQNLGAYKSIRNMLLVRFYLNIKSAFGWDHGRIKSFMRVQKKYDYISTETNRFIQTLEKNGISGRTDYPLKGAPVDDKNIIDIFSSGAPIAFLIGGKLQPKKWPLEHWIELAGLLGDKEKIFLVGGEKEKQDGDYIQANSPNAINLCGQLTIPELYSIFKKTKLAISLDTGAMHLCDAAGTGLIALFSTRDLSNKWFPDNKNAVVMERVLPCSFCLKTKCNNNICMSGILPVEVYSRARVLLEDRFNDS